MKKKTFLGILLCLMVFLASCKKQNFSKSEPTKEDQIPTFFFHGYSGTENSFKGMVKRLEKNHQGNLTTKILVTKKGELQVSPVKKSKFRPLIQVMFEDNKSTVENQVQWIQKVLNWSTEQKMPTINVVGHSMGGVSSLQVLLQLKDTRNVPKIAHFVSLGAPFNGFEQQESSETVAEMLQVGPKKKSPLFQETIKKLANFPQDTAWLNIAGLLEESDPNQGDGSVPLNSALGITSYAKNYQLTYEKHTFIGKKAQHSKLHENKEVDEKIAQFLWE